MLRFENRCIGCRNRIHLSTLRLEGDRHRVDSIDFSADEVAFENSASGFSFLRKLVEICNEIQRFLRRRN